MDQIWACEVEYLRAYCDKVLRATEETEQAAAAAFGRSGSEEREILTVEGDTAFIEISGSLSNRRSVVGWFFGYGGTTYKQIQDAISRVSENPGVKTVRLLIDSPGGTVTGLDEVWMALRALGKTKRIVAENHGLMASGAYWIATAADRIVATSPSAETGSIGVYLVVTDWSEYDKKTGIKDIRIVSKNAPNKNPDPATKAGIQAFQDRLDALERVFIDRVAVGRGVPRETVEQDFGRGGVLIAEDPDKERADAVSVGMIDSVIGGKGLQKGDMYGDSGQDDDQILGGPTTFKDYPVIDKKWDADAAIGRVRTLTGSTEKPSASYKNAFFWYDSDKADTFGAYKLPFCDVDDGKLKAVKNGVYAAKGAMAGARGNKPDIPEADVEAVNKHIDKYVQKIENEEDDDTDNAKEGASMKYSELAEKDPELKTEVDEKIEAAKAEAKEEVERLMAKVNPILSGEYPEHVKSIAADVASGKKTVAELDAAVSTFEAMKEAGNTAAAQGESVQQGNTPPAPPAGGQTDGEIRTEEDYQQSVAKFRAGSGMEGK